MSFAPENPPLAKPETLLRVPVGLASPLWGLFAGAAVSGAAWWWMTRWTRPQNLEAMFAGAETLETAVEPAQAALETPVAEALEAVEAAEPVVEAVVEAAPDPVAEPVVEATMDVASEAAPELSPEPVTAVSEPEVVEPVVIAGGAADVALEAAPEPKPRKKTAASKPD